MTIILNGTTGITTPGITNQGVVEFTAGSVSAPSITTTSDTNTGIYFPAADTIAFTEGGVESMRIDSSGNVGIGTASPGEKLVVAGNISALGVSGGARYIGTLNETSAYTGTLVLQAGGGSTGFGGGVVMYGHSHATYPGSVWIGRSSGSGGPIMFGDGGIGPGTEQMRLTSGGDLLVGTTSNTSSSKFAVNGRVGFYDANGNQNAANFVPNKGLGATNSAGFGLGFVTVNYTPASASSNIYWDGNNGFFTLSTSARKYKRNIVRVSNEQLDKALLLKPSYYQRLEYDYWEYGFIAEEVNEIGFDEFVTRAEGEISGLNYEKMVTLAFGLIQRQEKAIKQLEAKVTALESK